MADEVQLNQLHTVDSNGVWDVHTFFKPGVWSRSGCLGKCVDGKIRHSCCAIPWIRICRFWLGGEVGCGVGKYVWAGASRSGPGIKRGWLWHRPDVQN